MARLVLPFLLLLIAVSANAQRIFDLGFKAGISRDDITLENVADHTTILGWQAGVFARVKPPLTPGLQAEVLYNNTGSDLRLTDAMASDANIRLQYVQVPLFLVFSLGPAEIHLGAYGSHLLNASITNPLAIHEEYQALRANEFQDTDYGLLGGAGFRAGRIYAGARYLIGLGTIGAADNNILRNARNMQAQFHVGYGLFK